MIQKQNTMTSCLRLGARLLFGPLRRAAVAVLLAALAVGCTKDIIHTPDGGPEPGLKDNYATLQLVVPGVATPSTRSAAVGDETLLKENLLHAAVYSRTENGGWRFDRVSQPEDIRPGDTEENGYRTYTLRIPFGEGDYDRSFRVGLIAGITLEELKDAAGYEKNADGEEQWVLFSNSAIADRDQDGNPIPVVNPMAKARAGIEFTTAGKWPVPPGSPDFTPFPMWGESEEFRMRPQGTIAGTIKLIRSVARIDVGVNFRKKADGKFPLNEMLADGLYNGGRGTYFKLEEVYVCRTAKSGTYGAGEEVYADGKLVTKPTPPVPYEIFNDRDYDDDVLTPLKYTDTELTKSGNDVSEEEHCRRCLTRMCYIPETLNNGKEFDEAACLVVGGRYDKPDAAITYYRIDIAKVRTENGSQMKPRPEDRYHILRNNCYVVNITSVNGHGEQTAKDALYNDNTKMSAEVVEWNQSQEVGDIVTDGVYSLAVDRSELQYYSDGTSEPLTVKTDYDAELGKGWTLTVDGNADFKQALLYFDAQGKSIDYDTPGWPSQGLPGTAELRFGMKELENNPDGTVNTRQGRLIFTAGRMKTQVVITQTSRELLRLLFDPGEVYFGPKGPTKRVTVRVTTNKGYKLTIDNVNGRSFQLYPNRDAGGHADFKQFFTFIRNTNDGLVYELCPREQSETDPDRVWSFDFTAERINDDGTPVDATDPAMKVSETFNVYQLKEPVIWKLTGAPGGEMRENPWEVIVPNEATSATAMVETTPGSLVWWFSNGGSSTGNDSWLTNLAAWIGKKIENIATNYPSGFVFNMEPNPGLARRSITLPVNTNTPGLDANTKLVITQKGAPLKLKPSDPLTNKIKPTPEPETENTRVYTLDHGTGSKGGSYSVDMTSNTDWYWYWNKDDRQLHDANFPLLITSWTATSGEKVVTTDGPKDGRNEKTWNGVFKFDMPDFTASEPNDKDMPNPATPLGGRRTVTMELRNDNPLLTEADVLGYARQLRITRELPAFANLVKWPFRDNLADVAPISLDLMLQQNKYKDGVFEILSNASVKLEVTSGETENSQPVRVDDTQWSSANGYDRWKYKFSDFPHVRVDQSTEFEPVNFYKLSATYTDREVRRAEGANKEYTESRLYYTGTQIKTPLRNMETGMHYLSSGTHTLKLDFKDSYFARVTMRVKLKLVNTDLNENQVDQYIQWYQTQPEAKRQREEILTLTNGKEEITLENGTNTVVTVELPANTHQNMMYKVVAQYKKTENGQDEWIDVPGLMIYQDGIPIDGYGRIVKYGPQTWGFTHSSGGAYVDSQLASKLPSVHIPNTPDKVYWIEPSPYSTVGNNTEAMLKLFQEAAKRGAFDGHAYPLVNVTSSYKFTVAPLITITRFGDSGNTTYMKRVSRIPNHEHMGTGIQGKVSPQVTVTAYGNMANQSGVNRICFVYPTTTLNYHHCLKCDCGKFNEYNGVNVKGGWGNYKRGWAAWIAYVRFEDSETGSEVAGSANEGYWMNPNFNTSKRWWHTIGGERYSGDNRPNDHNMGTVTSSVPCYGLVYQTPTSQNRDCVCRLPFDTGTTDNMQEQ